MFLKKSPVKIKIKLLFYFLLTTVRRVSWGSQTPPLVVIRHLVRGRAELGHCLKAIAAGNR